MNERKSFYLESSHVTRIAGILQTILVALQEEFEKEPRGQKRGKKKVLVSKRCTTKVGWSTGADLAFLMRDL